MRDAVLLAETGPAIAIRVAGALKPVGNRDRTVIAYTDMRTPAADVVAELRALAATIERDQPALVEELIRRG